MCPVVQVCGCAWPVWQPKPTRGSGSAVLAAAHRRDRYARSAAKPPRCWPASPPPAAHGDGAERPQLSRGGHLPDPTTSQPGRTWSGTAKLLRPHEHQSGCWYSVSGKSAAFASDGKRVVGGKLLPSVPLNDASLNGRSSGAAGWLPGAALGRSQWALPGAASVRDAPPEPSQALHAGGGCPPVALRPCSSHALPLGDPGEDGPHLPIRTRGVPTSHCQTHEQAKTRCRAGDAHPARCASIARASTTPGMGRGFSHVCLPGGDFGEGEGLGYL